MSFLKTLIRERERREDTWEALCKKCGLCCFGKESRFFRTTIHLSQPCEYFDRRTRLCKVYRNRFRASRWCGKVTIYHALLSRSLPSTCGYVERYRRWRLVSGAEIKE